MISINSAIKKMSGLLKKDPSGESAVTYLTIHFSDFSRIFQDALFEEAELMAYPPKTEIEQKRLLRLKLGHKYMPQRGPLRHHRNW